MTLVSPGVSVTIIDESFYIPASAPTIPLLFVATRANKTQPDGVTAASGTAESGVVRSVTSIGQSTQLYGIPYFRTDSSDNPFHGDARNEYGLFALNQFLGVGNLAYVVRANIDLSDSASTFIGIGTPIASTATRVGIGDGTIASITASSAFVKPETIDVIMTSSTEFTVEGSNSGIIGTGTVGTAFTSTIVNFTITAGTTAFSSGDYFEFELVYTFSTQTGTGDGTLTDITVEASAVAETITIEFTNATTFTVTGSVSGSLTGGQ